MALSLLTAFLWGILPIALKVVLQKLDVYTVTWFRFLVSFGLLAVYLTARRELPALRKLRSQSWMLLAIAILFLAGNYVLFLIGLAKTSPANAQVLVQLAPVLMGLGGLVIFKERYTQRQWCGLSVMVAGFALFFHEKLKILIGAQTNYLAGSAIIILAAGLWAVYGLAQKQLLQNLPSSSIMLIIYGSCAVMFSCFANPRSLLTLNFLEWGMLIFCALNTLIAYGAFAEALEHWEASQVSAVLAVTPIFTLISVTAASSFFPTFVAPELLTILAVAGAILVVSGSAVISLGKSR